MMGLFIFLYGTMVFAIVSLAIGLISWGIVNERRDRTQFQQGREVFGERAAVAETTRPHGSMRAQRDRGGIRRRRRAR
jgi:membrane protein implicated in regulation of membrane protease activity